MRTYSSGLTVFRRSALVCWVSLIPSNAALRLMTLLVREALSMKNAMGRFATVSLITSKRPTSLACKPTTPTHTRVQQSISVYSVKILDVLMPESAERNQVKGRPHGNQGETTTFRCLHSPQIFRFQSTSI